MQRNPSGTLCLFMAVVFVGCGPDRGALEDEGVPMGEVETEPGTPGTAPTGMTDAVAYEAAFEAEQPGDAPMTSGSLQILAPEEMGGDYRLEVILSGLSEGEHAWHIHGGPCGENASIVLPLSSTPDQEGAAGPLEANAQGQASTTVDVPGFEATWLNAGTHSVHVHEGTPEAPGASVACATF
ncbi:MAG: CHRD domain-containing protein [Gemmatimonadota bacterium]|nr:CHRD domain-containing protein [Gemmatimonadota bacterium]